MSVSWTITIVYSSVCESSTINPLLSCDTTPENPPKLSSASPLLLRESRSPACTRCWAGGRPWLTGPNWPPSPTQVSQLPLVCDLLKLRPSRWKWNKNILCTLESLEVYGTLDSGHETMTSTSYHPRTTYQHPNVTVTKVPLINYTTRSLSVPLFFYHPYTCLLIYWSWFV